MPITVLLGSDRLAWVQSIRRHLSICASAPSGQDFACHAATLAELPLLAAALQPEVVILEPAGAAAAFTPAQVKQLCERARVLLVCEDPALDMVLEAVRNGASGLVSVADEPALVARAVRAVHAGATWFARGAMYEALHSLVCPPGAALPVLAGKLTRREEQILELIGAGLTNKEIARRLEISDKTVKTHLHRVYVKLNRSGRYKAFLSQAQGPADSLAPDLEWATLENLAGPR